MKRGMRNADKIPNFALKMLFRINGAFAFVLAGGTGFRCGERQFCSASNGDLGGAA